MDFSERKQRAYTQYGFAHISGGEVVRELVAPVQHGVARAIALVAKHADVEVTGLSFEAAFDALCAKDRALGSQVYDVVRQLPAFSQLASAPAIESLAQAALGTEDVAIAHAGSGVRIDRPGEQEFAADWHQEFPAQGRAKRGVTLWIPLVPVDAEMGPVELCPGTQKAGVLPTRQRDDRPGAYGIEIENIDDVLRGQMRIAPPTEVGDLLLIDYLTVHRSGKNQSLRTRWSVQVRYFSMACQWGVAHRWAKAIASAGVKQAPHAVSSQLQADSSARAPYVAPRLIRGMFPIQPSSVTERAA